MGRKCNDVYGEEKVYYYPGAIVRVRRPILTEEERAPADEDHREGRRRPADGGVSEKVRERRESMTERKRQRTRRERGRQMGGVLGHCGCVRVFDPDFPAGYVYRLCGGRDGLVSLARRRER